MKRRLRIIAIFLLLGAVVNVAVAWGCAAWAQRMVQPWQYDPVANRHWHPSHSHWHAGPPPGEPGLPSAEDKKWWAAHAPGSFAVVEPIAASSFSHFGINKIDMWKLEPDSPRPGPGFSMSRTWTGWPVRSMEGAEWFDGGRGRVVFGTGLLPLRLLWPGFAVNTLSYAALLWLLIPGPFALRRFLRLKRGL